MIIASKIIMRRKTIFITLKVIIFVGIITSCSVTKRLQNGEYLLSSNEFKIEYADSVKDKNKLDKGEVKAYIPKQQTPNGKVLGYNLALKIYNMAKPGSNSWGNRILRKIGQPPVIYDSVENSKILRNLKLYFNSEGFYNSKVTDTVIYKGKRASVKYNIEAGAPYVISSYKYNFLDSTVMPFILTESSKSIIKPGMILKHSLLENERARITDYLANNGFYYFYTGSIDYLIDTINLAADVTININQRVIDRVPTDHKQYKINDIKINSSNRSLLSLNTPNPTFTTKILDSIEYSYASTIKGVKPKVLSRLLTIEPGQLIVKNNLNDTKNKLSSISFFRSVNMTFKEATDSTRRKEISSSYGALDCEILLSQELKQGYKIDAEVSTNNNYSGLSLTLGYNNKNLFRGGEILNVSATGGYDFVHNKSNKDSWEIGGNATLIFPRLLAPFKMDKLRKLNNISTQVDMLINSQRRPYYDRTITSISYGYSWNSGNKLSFLYKPIAISLIKVPWKYDEYIESIPNEYLRKSYDSQLIAGSNFSVLFKDARLGLHKYSIISNIETSGNLLNLGSLVFQAKKQETNNERYYNILGIRYAQYVRADLTFTYEIQALKKLAFAYRLYGGYGYAYGNTNSLPFERFFFAGGGSSMRGWQVRTLGPGNVPYDDKQFPNQVGNIRLETNLEARFPIYKIFHGAIFFDLGNIWSNTKGEENSEARFKFDNFYNQLAFNTGAGIRLDFDFFVVRMDWGIQLFNPGFNADNRWINKFNFKNTALHFAIGYPF